METPTNPTLKLIDIQAAADVAHETEVSYYSPNYFSSSYKE